MVLRCRLFGHAARPLLGLHQSTLWYHCARCLDPIREVLPGQVPKVRPWDLDAERRRAFWQQHTTKPSNIQPFRRRDS
jgi:hypothetical protein